MSASLDSKLGSYINVAALVTLIASVLTIYFFVDALNRGAERTDRILLSAGIDAATSQNHAWAVDYGWWDATLQLVEENDPAGMASVMGSAFSEHSGFDFIAVASKADTHVYAWHRNTGEETQTGLISPTELAALRADLVQAYANGETITSHFLSIDDVGYIASVTVLGEYEDRAATDPATDPLILVGLRLDSDFLQMLEDRFLLSDVALHLDVQPTSQDALALVDAAGHNIGTMSFTPSRPGNDMLRRSILPLIGYIAAVFFAAQLIIRKAGVLARQAEHNERMAVRAAGTDNLSGLPNRQNFTAFISSAAAVAAATRGEATVIYIDLNGFKAVNDTAGHRAGDQVIQEVAQRFRASVGDEVHLARVGGDEFACALIGKADSDRALDIADALADSLADPFVIDGEPYRIGGAIGIAWSRPDAVKDFAQLVHDADLAMYRAKADQADRPLCFDPEFGAEDAALRAMEKDIETGLAAGEFHVVYQPIVRASDGHMVSAEALLRWDHPERGSIPPAEFIPVADGSRLIAALGDFVLETVCREIGPGAGYPVSINISSGQLTDRETGRRYVEILGRHGMTPADIELELTETGLIDDFDLARSRMVALHEAGFRISLDDFGTGFASLGYLRSLPFDRIKVDRSFVALIGRNDSSNKLFQALALLAEALELDLVAEGVETEEQASMLRLLGFAYLQGWHFGRPVPAADLRERDAGAA